MSRYDKYDPVSGGFRAPSNFAWTATSGPASVTDLGRIIVVALNGSGRVIKATTAVSAVGVVIANGPVAVGDILDVMTSGEIVELAAVDLQSGSPAAGTKYYFDATASRLATTAPVAAAIGFYVGTTVEATRLVVRAGLAGAL
jgi:hypothetical protein